METLAASAIGLVAPYLAKGAEEFAKAAGQAGFDQCKALVGRLQRWWSGDPVAAAAADNLAKDPQKYGKLLGQLLSADLANDPTFAAELRKLVEGVGPSVEVIQKMEIANGVTGADIGELVTGRVRVEQTIADAANVTGFKANKVGGG
jgi:hypothetical protein